MDGQSGSEIICRKVRAGTAAAYKHEIHSAPRTHRGEAFEPRQGAWRVKRGRCVNESTHRERAFEIARRARLCSARGWTGSARSGVELRAQYS